MTYTLKDIIYTDEVINDKMDEIYKFICDNHYEIVDAAILSSYYIKLCQCAIITMEDVEKDCIYEINNLKRFMPRLKDDEKLFKVMVGVCDEHFDKIYKHYNSVDKLYLALLKLCYEKDETLVPTPKI